MPPDLIRRFNPTPLAATLKVNGATLQVATNDQLLLDRLGIRSDAVGRDGDEEPAAKWRIVVEEENEAPDNELSLDGLTHGGLSFIRIAHRSFLASDLQTHSGISFIERNLVRNQQLFEQYFFPAFLLLIGEMKATT